MVWEIAPAVLDAVAAFAYGMSRITEAFEAHERMRASGNPKEDDS